MAIVVYRIFRFVIQWFIFNRLMLHTMLSIAYSSCLSFLPQLSNQRGELTRQKCHQTEIMMRKDGRFPPHSPIRNIGQRPCQRTCCIFRDSFFGCKNPEMLVGIRRWGDEPVLADSFFLLLFPVCWLGNWCVLADVYWVERGWRWVFHVNGTTRM